MRTLMLIATIVALVPRIGASVSGVDGANAVAQQAQATEVVVLKVEGMT